MTQTWCAIPVYNNATTVVDIVRRARAQIERVIVVDDGSTDADLCDLLKPLDVEVIRHQRNRGKGEALLTAFRAVAERGGQYVITLDGDGQHFPEDIPHFLPLLQPATILVGMRVGEMPRASRFGRRFSDFWIWLETSRKVVDSQSGFRAYPVAPMLKLKMWSRHYNFEVEILTRALWAGLTVGSVPIRVWYAEAGKRISSFHPFKDNLRMTRLHIRLLLRRLIPIHQKLA
jgi:glycosyltransferase involved in cell wall biosynthesis